MPGSPRGYSCSLSEVLVGPSAKSRQQRPCAPYTSTMTNLSGLSKFKRGVPVLSQNGPKTDITPTHHLTASTCYIHIACSFRQSLVPTDSLILDATQPEIRWNRGSFWNWRSYTYTRVSISIFYVFGGMIKSQYPIVSLSLSFSQLIPGVFPNNDSFQKNVRSQREPEVFRIISLGVRQVKTQKGINIQAQTRFSHPKEITSTS